MCITVNELKNNCIFASLIHALMTMQFPELSYEQSWDDENYSIVCGDGRFTISFDEDNCVGAFRCCGCGDMDADRILLQVPSEIAEIAKTETFQYLLDDINGVVIPSISGMFYIFNENLIMIPHSAIHQLNDVIPLSRCLFEGMSSITNYLVQYYDMNSRQMEYVYGIFTRILDNQFKEINIAVSEIRAVFGGDGITECIDSFREMGISIEL